jgi:nucleolar protein 12
VTLELKKNPLKMSLVGSIFGGSATKPNDEKRADGSLSNLFAQSSALPEKPQHKPFPPRKRKETSSEHEEPKKKRKAPREKTEEVEDDEPSARTPEEEAKNNVDERTIFVGNLPLTTTRKSLASLFKSCGKVESSRLRSVAAAGVKLSTDRAGDQVRHT